MVEPRENAAPEQRRDAGPQVFSTRYTATSAGPADRRTVDLAYRRPGRRRLRRPLILAGLLALFGAGVWVARDTGPGTPATDTPPAVPADPAHTTAPDPAPAPEPQPPPLPPPPTAEIQPPDAPPPAEPVTLPAPEPPSPGIPAIGGMRLQLGSYKSEAAARAGADRLRSRFPEPLSGIGLSVVPADLGAKGVFYRVIAGPADPSRAGAVCAALKAQKAGCLPMRP